MSKLLINEHPLQVLPSLAKEVGLNEAIILQQLHYWLAHATVLHDGKKWVFNTTKEWVESDFPFMSESTFKRAITSLKKSGLLLIERLSKTKNYHVNYYSIDYKKLDELEQKINKSVTQSNGSDCTNRTGQNDPIEQVKMTQSIGSNCTNALGQNDPIISETTTENTSETNKKNKQKKFDAKTIDLPGWVNLDAWLGFVEMRTLIKKPMTERAATMILNKLESFRANGYDPNQLLDNSTRNNWQDIYQPKGETHGNTHSKANTGNTSANYGAMLDQQKQAYQALANAS